MTGAAASRPTGWAAVVLNITVMASTAGGFLTVYPSGGLRPETSNLNFMPARPWPTW